MSMMKRFTDWYRGNNDIEKEPPRKGIRRVGYLLVNHTGKMVVFNVLFLLCSLPVITIPAALSALNCCMSKLFCDGYGVEISDFFHEFRFGLTRYLPAGLLNGALGFYAYYLLSLANNFPQGAQHDIVTGIGLGVAVIAVLLGSYTFVLSAMLELPCRHLLKNAGILILLEWKSSLAVLCVSALFAATALMLLPYSVFWLLVAGFSVHQLCVCAAVCPSVKKRIVEPFERQQRMG